MKPTSNRGFSELDGLRLLGLSRISRCADCRRLRALQAAYDGGTLPAAPLPPAPKRCSHRYCEPLVARVVDSGESRTWETDPAGPAKAYAWVAARPAS